MSKEKGAYSPNNTKLRIDTNIDQGGNPKDSDFGRELPIDNLHTEPGSKPLPVPEV
jgi:hypothetical protein